MKFGIANYQIPLQKYQKKSLNAKKDYTLKTKKTKYIQYALFLFCILFNLKFLDKIFNHIIIRV